MDGEGVVVVGGGRVAVKGEGGGEGGGRMAGIFQDVGMSLDLTFLSRIPLSTTSIC